MGNPKIYKVLVAFAGIGVQSKLWKDKNIKVTAVENIPEIAKVYKQHHPEHEVIVADAYEYVENHYKEFDIIILSPDCITHSQFRRNCCVKAWGCQPLIPDGRLYGLIVFLQDNFKGAWVVENVRPYYTPFIAPTAYIQRHNLWACFPIPPIELPPDDIRNRKHVSIEQKSKELGFDLSNYRGSLVIEKRKLLNNGIHPKLGLHMLNCALDHLKKQKHGGSKDGKK